MQSTARLTVKSSDKVIRRLHVFHNRSLVKKSVEAPVWMEKNAFNVLLWIVKELSLNATYIDLLPTDNRRTRPNHGTIPFTNFLTCEHTVSGM